ncbi:hypothetical protein Tco_1090673 [Tanacetum coccineum]|uniref:Uncharacterized protein n=1 Tax=Tanacetum coccineum TaxID=301880 RepID=A0ABQ5I4Y0_9ASTR
MTDADQGGADQQNVSQESGFEQVKEDAYVTCTPVLDIQKTDEPLQSSPVSSDFTSKLLNLENPSLADNEIASLMDTTVRHEAQGSQTSSLYTVSITAVPEIASVPPPPFFNPLSQQATPTLIPTTSEATTSFPSLPDFSAVFKFNNRVTNLEKDLSEIKQVDQEEAQAKKRDYIELVDTSMRAILKEEVNTQLPHILPQAVLDFAIPAIEKNVTESLEAAVLARSSSQPNLTYEAATSLFEFELTKILIDKMEKNKSYDKADYKRELYDALVKSYQTDKDLFDTYGKVFTLKRSQDDKDKDQDPSTGSDRGTKRRKSSMEAESSRDSSHTVDDSGVQQNQEFDTGNNDEQPADKEVSKADCQVARAEEPRTSFDELMDTSFDFTAFVLNRLNIKDLTQEILVGPAFELLKGTCKSLTKLEYHLEECSKASITLKRGSKAIQFREGDFPRLRLQDIKDMLLLLVQQKLNNLIIDERYDLNVALRMFTRWIVIQRRVEDLQLGVESYQKKLNLTKPDTFRSNLKNRTTYIAYSDLKGVIYKDQYNRNRLIRTDELYKFSDGKLNDVRTALYDIASGIRIEYLPKRKWSGLDKRSARDMVQDIDKQLYERRLMWNLEKFVSGREYGNDLKLLEQTR